MRLLAYFTFLLALAAAGWAGQLFWQEWQARHAPEPPRQAAANPSQPQPPAPPAPSRQWPAVFGEPQPPAPPEPEPEVEKEEPQPPPRQFPPLDSLGYRLTGVVQVNGGIWATVSHPSGEQILREFDELEEGLIVTRIDERGLWAKPDGGEEMLLAFPD